MAHADRNDDSFQDLPPLREIRSAREIVDPAVSPRAAFNLGAFTGETMAVCSYAAPDYPALAAYHYRDGSVRWTSPIEDLPCTDTRRRQVGGLLMAKMALDGGPAQRYVFAANPAEFVAYTADGRRLWKRRNVDITAAAPQGVGGPVSVTFNDARELVAATSEGWIVKLHPADGRTVDAYKMDTRVVIAGRSCRGTLVTFKSPVVVGNVLYLTVEFVPERGALLPALRCPVFVVRVELADPEAQRPGGRIRPLAEPSASGHAPDRLRIGVNKGRGSPSGWRNAAGNVVILANARARSNQHPTVAAVEDDQGVLRLRWWSVLDVMPDDDIHAAPAFHGESRTLLISTERSIYVFRDAEALRGHVAAPWPVLGRDLVDHGIGFGRAAVQVGSPFALTFDGATNELVAYTNFRVLPRLRRRPFGFLGAFAIPLEGRGHPRPLWCAPLAVTATGMPAPGPGTYGQPALFRYRDGDRDATGLIVNTVHTGTYIFK